MSSCVMSHPELLVLYLFVEPLAPGERVVVKGLLSSRVPPSLAGGGGGMAVAAEGGGNGGGSGNGFEVVCVVERNRIVGDSNNTSRKQNVTADKFLSELKSSIEHFSGKASAATAPAAKINQVGQEERSTTFSSKSSLLARLADNLSVIAREESSKKSPLSSIGDQQQQQQQQQQQRAAATKTSDGGLHHGKGKEAEKTKRTKRGRFEDRLREALLRGDTPDSEEQRRAAGSPSSSQRRQHIVVTKTVDTRTTDSPKSQSRRRELGSEGPPSLSSSSSASGDSSYSFECFQGVEERDPEDAVERGGGAEQGDLECLMLGLVSVAGEATEEELRRAREVRALAAARKRRGLSESSAGDVLDPLGAADGGTVVRQRRWRRGSSVWIDRGFQERRVERISKDGQGVNATTQSNSKKQSPDKYAWVVSAGHLEDPARFLLTWLAVSLADIPLLVFQVMSNNKKKN